MPSRSLTLLRTLGLPTDVSRLEKSLFELRDDVDSALQAFLAKNQLLKRSRPLPEREAPSLDRETAPRDDAAPMAPLAPTTFDPASTYVCLSPSGRASTLEVTPEFWTTIDKRRD